jgi:hypothetical protein
LQISSPSLFPCRCLYIVGTISTCLNRLRLREGDRIRVCYVLGVVTCNHVTLVISYIYTSYGGRPVCAVQLTQNQSSLNSFINILFYLL